MSNAKTGDQTFHSEFGNILEGVGVGGKANGLTLRDYFAAKAMQGFTANYGLSVLDTTYAAKFAYKQADAMIAERAK